MSSFSVLTLPEDHFQCPICLKVFSDPVTTPCGHNFCKTCLSAHWDEGDSCSCPVCHKRFHTKPEICTNGVIEEISVRIKRRKLEVPEGTAVAAPWEVKCDMCAEVKLKALKSCLVCLTSYCDGHLEPHRSVRSLARHKLVEPVEKLEERLCTKHQKILEIYCRDERMCICLLCSETEHKHHHTVTVEEEGAQRRENIESRKETIKLMIDERTKKIKEVAETSGTRREKAIKEISKGEKLFSTLLDHVQVAETKLTANLEDKLRTSQEKDEATIEELQHEVAQLEKNYSELESLSRSDDPLHLLQTLQALDVISDSKDWSQVRVYSDMWVQTLRETMTRLVQTFQSQLKTLTDEEISRLRQYKESVTFDPATAGSFLAVYEYGKRMKSKKNADPSLSNGSERFQCSMVLGTTGYTSGRHYWEVEVGKRLDWDVGVAAATVSREEGVVVKRANGFFAIAKSGSDYRVADSPSTALHLCPIPRSVGVYLDYDEGVVSFYDVDRRVHIYSFTGESFTEKMFPYFYLYSNAKKSEPMVLRAMLDRDYYLSLIRSRKQLETSGENAQKVDQKAAQDETL